MRNEEDTVPNVNRIEICQLMALNDFFCKNPRISRLVFPASASGYMSGSHD
jgi:hypothetical protein